MISKILNDASSSYLISKPGKNAHIVIGVPHHAPFGNPKLPTLNKRPADENAGYLGFKLAELLQCSYVIACNYSFDVNKFWTSDYSRIIKQWQPEILIEIHGHGGNSSYYDIEISTGRSERENISKTLAENLIKANSNNDNLTQFTISGNFNKIFFQATMSKTINTDKWLALHIELPLQLREPSSQSNNTPSELGYTFCENLADSIKRTLNLCNIKMK